MLKTGNISSNFVKVLSIEFFLGKLVIAGAVVSDLWVWDTFSLTVSKSHSLVEIWAMWKASVCLSPVWIFLLGKLIVTGAVVVNLWVWNTSSLTISKGESLIEIWAMRKACMWCTPVWIISLSTELNLSLLTKLEIWVAVVTNLWIRNTLGFSILKSKSFIEVGAVLLSLNVTLVWMGSWILLNEGALWNKLDESLVLLRLAGGTNMWVLGDVCLAIVHNGSARVSWALRE